MSEIRTTRADVERATDINGNTPGLSHRVDAREVGSPSTPVGVYDRPVGARSASNNTMFLILLILVIVILAFLAYRWWF